MGSRFPEQLTHWTDPAGKLLGRDHHEQVQSRRTDAERPRTRHFREQREEQVAFRQWSDGFTSWVEQMDQDFATMLKLAAQMQEWDKDKFIAAAQQDYRLGAEKVAEFDKHIYVAMKRLAAGIAREIVDTSKTAGGAWYRLADPCYEKKRPRRNRHCQSTPRTEATCPHCRIFFTC